MRRAVRWISVWMLGWSGLVMAAPVGPRDGQVSVVSRPLIAGLWVYQTPEMRCGEYYNFDETGNFLIQSGAEWSRGNYTLDLPDAGEEGLPMLTLNIRYENNEMDCSGQQVDQSNQAQRQYVQWQADGRQIRFCGGADGSQCLMTLRRILP